ncbi:lactoylglutathione lyase [Streptococcus cuniculi]|uniref:Aldoketomutase n=2 Tax=Streptococcus TaxID=1301 RepID=A0A6I4REE6_9STRE|nr:MULTISPECIES: VOC family protein [Streptococcus]MTB64193.1 lactoylglutathione lyase [Streptococcus sp. zg-86]MTB90481.1 lactoylglutathione lyase [Streptococcus sp. zg-36]MWV56180.1 lactoylglutathione lyase [Streptococcus sp. zg-70]OLF48149.1 lactoylglutathione lyase [Streptococcus cuniculi]QTH48198.1 VOC family protein [Streptococcus sp. zg-86]
MASKKMLHACLRVENLEASQEFYEKAFGFKETRRKDYPEHKFTLVYLALPGDEFEIELTYNYDHGPYVVGDGFSHLALSSDDLEGDNAKHKALGYPTTDLSGLPGNPGRYYFVTDPDGYRVEVIRAD